MEPIGISWEPIHQRLMQAFWEAINANVERIERPPGVAENTPQAQYDFHVPEGFPEGSKQFFEAMAHGIVRVQMEGILQNLVDAAMTAVAKEMSQIEFAQK